MAQFKASSVSKRSNTYSVPGYLQDHMLERVRNYQAYLIQHGAEASEAGNSFVADEVAWPWFVPFFAGALLFLAVDYLADPTATVRTVLALLLLFPVLGMTYAMSVCLFAYIRTDLARYHAMNRQPKQSNIDVR